MAAGPHVGRVRHEQRLRLFLAELLQARRDVHRVADHRVLVAVGGADRPREHVTGVNADADAERRLAALCAHAVQIGQAIVHAECAAQGRRRAGVLARAAVRLEEPEHHQHRVADELVDEAAAFAHPDGHRGEELVQAGDDLGRRRAFRHRGEAAQIAEQDRRAADLAGQADAAREQAIAHRRLDHPSEGLQDALAVAERLDHRVDAVGEDADLVGGVDEYRHVEVAALHLLERGRHVGERQRQRARDEQREQDAEHDEDHERDRAGGRERGDDLGGGPSRFEPHGRRAHEPEQHEQRDERDRDQEEQEPGADAGGERARHRGDAALRKDRRRHHRAEQPVDQEIRDRRREEAVHERSEHLLRHEVGAPMAEVPDGERGEDDDARHPQPETHEREHGGRVRHPPLHELGGVLGGAAAKVDDDRLQIEEHDHEAADVGEAAPERQERELVRARFERERAHPVHELDRDVGGDAGQQIGGDDDQGGEREPRRHERPALHGRGRAALDWPERVALDWPGRAARGRDGTHVHERRLTRDGR